MKAWQWIMIAGAIVVVGIFIIEEKKKSAMVATGGMPGTLNPATSNAIVALGGGIGALLSNVFKSSGNKVSAPAGGNIYPGDSTAWDPSGSAAAPPTFQPSSDPFGIGPLHAPDFPGQASGGTDAGGGLTGAQSSNVFGIPQLTAPDFGIGVNGADFASN